MIAKELYDNGLDGAEMAGVPPEITVCWSGSQLMVADNGGGIPAEVVRKLIDYSTRTSDKLSYVSPMPWAAGQWAENHPGYALCARWRTRQTHRD